MPVNIAIAAFRDGISTIPYGWTIIQISPWLALVYLLKLYSGGASNTSERKMHSKVVLMTGGTSGIGAAIAESLASRGAQLVLLTQHPLTDPFVQEYILDLRQRTSNNLITAEHCDLSSLHSIRLFATKWIDNAPPRRLDMLVLCGNVQTPRGGKIEVSKDGVEAMWGVNYLANFHLLSILSPALRAQPADRDVRVILGACGAYAYGELPESSSPPSTEPKSAAQKPKNTRKTTSPSSQSSEPVSFSAGAAFASSQLALVTFAHSLQSHFSSYKRPDLLPPRTSVFLVDPGPTRTPGMRRHLTFGSLWGLLLYLITWPLWWLVLKSPDRGAQSFLWAAMDENVVRGLGGSGLPDLAGENLQSGAKPMFIRECRVVGLSGRKKAEIEDEEVQKRLWKLSEATVEVLETEGAMRRAREKQDAGKAEEGDEKQKVADGGKGGGAMGGEKGRKLDSRRSRKA